MSYPLLRRVNREVGQKLDAQVLQMNGNEKDNAGGGGTCFGDSGGPASRTATSSLTPATATPTSAVTSADTSASTFPSCRTGSHEFGVQPAT